MSDTWIRTVSAVVGLIGSTGFVAAAGGATLWARFDAAQLPADQAVAAVPKGELIVVGAGALGVFLVAAVAALVAVYVLDVSGRPGGRTRRGLIALMIVELALAIAYIESRVLVGLLLGLAFAVAGVLLVHLLDSAARAVKPAGAAAPAAPDDAGAGVLARAIGWASARLWAGSGPFEAARRLAAAVVLVGGAVLIAVVNQGIFVVLWLVPLVALVAWPARRSAVDRHVLAVALLAYGLIALIRFDEPLAAVTLVAVFLGLLNLAMARATGNRFAFYGVSVFLSVVLFGGVLNYVRTRENPKLQAVAVLLKGDGGSACGLYVTENDERLYLARADVVGGGRRVRLLARSGRIFWLPRDQIARSSLGPLQGIIRAQANAADLRDELLSEQRRPAVADMVAGPKAEECTPGPPAVALRMTDERKLARRLQPRLVVDRADRFWPVSVLTMFKLRRGDKPPCRRVARGECVDVTRAGQLPWIGGTGEWLDYPGADTSVGQQHEDMVAALRSRDPARTAREYFFVTGGEPDRLTSVQYWFFYTFNYQKLGFKGSRLPATAGFHEGDFETVGVLLSRESKRPVYVWMARHDTEGRPFAWSEPQLERTGEHLRLYAARGSHATYESCGSKHRQRVGAGVINDVVPCDPARQLVFEPQVTPLSDLAFAPWVCWEGRFGTARRRGLEGLSVYFASGPASPLSQQKFPRRVRPCAAVQAPPQRPDLGEEVLDDVTAATLRTHGGRLQGVFDSCEDWFKPPAAGVYVVACSKDLLRAFFKSGLEDAGDAQIVAGRRGQRARPPSVPAIYRSPTDDGVDGVTLRATKPVTASVYAVCFAGERQIVARFEGVRLEEGRSLVLRTGPSTWSLEGGGRPVSARPETRASSARCAIR